MRHWGWEGHSGRRRWARRAHPGSAGQGGSGSLGWGVGGGEDKHNPAPAGTQRIPGSLQQPVGSPKRQTDAGAPSPTPQSPLDLFSTLFPLREHRKGSL